MKAWIMVSAAEVDRVGRIRAISWRCGLFWSNGLVVNTVVSNENVLCLILNWGLYEWSLDGFPVSKQ